MILFVRLFTSLGEISFKKTKSDPNAIITIMFFSFTLSELIPLSLVVYGVYL